MTGPRMTVYGGHGGFRAHVEDIGRLGDLFRAAGAELGELGLQVQRFLADPDVIAAAGLDPQGAASFERLLLEALDGPRGLLAVAALVEEHSLKLAATALAYETADQMAATSALETRLGTDVLDLSTARQEILLDMIVTRDPNPLDAANRFITDHPGIVQDVLMVAPVLVTGLDLAVPPLGYFVASKGKNPFPVTEAQWADIFTLVWPPTSKFKVTPVQSPVRDRFEPPRGLGEAMTNFLYRATGPDGGPGNPGQDGKPAEIGVQVIQHADGSCAYIVNIPGTRRWNLAPWSGENQDINDWNTNVAAMAGDQTAYQSAIEEALASTHPPPGPHDPVMLVGHSQGGMVAMRLAGDPGFTNRYKVTNVVTAGAPVGQMPVSPKVQVLSIVNSHDLVPHLQPGDNPDLPNRTTVVIDQQEGGIFQNHDIDIVYRSAAQRLDTSPDPSVTAFRNSASPFFTGQGTTYAYTVSG